MRFRIPARLAAVTAVASGAALLAASLGGLASVDASLATATAPTVRFERVIDRPADCRPDATTPAPRRQQEL